MPRRPARLERRMEGVEMAVTFAYDLRRKSFLHEKASTRKVTSEFALLCVLHVILQPGEKTRPKKGSGWGSYGPLDGCTVS